MLEMGGDELDTERVRKIIDHPVRLRIIELLGSEGPLSWKELAGRLGTGTGALYYHLDTLERIVTRDSTRRYALTKFGLTVYDYLRANPSRTNADELAGVLKKSGPRKLILNFFIPRPFLDYIVSSRLRSVICLVFSMALASSLSLSAEAQVLVYSFGPATSVWVSLGALALSILSVCGIAYAAATVVFGQRPDPLSLLSSSALSFVPVTVLAYALHIISSMGAPGVLTDRSVLAVVLALFQSWAVMILGAGMSVSTGLRVEKTLLIGLVLLYASMGIVFAQGQIL